MDELSETNHQIKLTIQEGRNFENVLYPTIIAASLNNHSLETNLIQPDNNPQYLTSLMWEVEKKHLRVMRSGQTPLKIECFAINEEGNRERIGYILHSIRTAQIIPKNEDIDVRFNWHTLSGLRGDLKSSKPELLLSLVIEDIPSNIITKKINRDTLPYQDITPVLLEHEHLIQLGPVDSCHDLFIISVMAGIVNNLDILIKESILNEQMEDVSFCYHIMNTDIRLKPFNKSSEKQWILNEKISIRIRSSLSVLRNYFQLNPYLLIFLKFKDNIVSQSKLDVRPLIFTSCINEFVKKTQNSSTSLEKQCILLKDGETFSAHEPKASISIKFKVQYVDKKNEQSQFPRIPPEALPPKIPNLSNNQYIKETQPVRVNSADSYRDLIGELENPILRHYADSNISYNNRIMDRSFVGAEDLNFTNECPTSIEAFHCYCLNVYLIGIKLFSTCPLIRNFEFRFHHPKVEIMSTLHPALPIMTGGKLSLQNVGYKLHFISSEEEIKNLLISFPPRISVCDDNSSAKICIAQTLLDVQRLFNQQKPECQYEASLIDSDGSQIGTLDVIMNLEDHGPYYNDKSRNSVDNLGPPILDDSLVYKIVDELESWKEKQKEMFRAELKNKEERYLNLLGEEWRKKKEALEAKLANSVEQCKMLANSLNNATEDLRIRRLKSHEKETRLLKMNEDLQNKYEMKIQDLRLSAEKMQNDFGVKLALFEECKNSHISQIENLKRENEKLRQTINSQEEKIMEYEKGTLSREQVTSLLQEVKVLEEKLAKAEENKSFYKDQWFAIHNEMQKTKSEYQHVLEMQIKSSREELKNVGYDDILSANTEALENDQLCLDEMKKQLRIIRPKSTHSITDREPVFAPLNSLLSQPSQSAQKANFSTYKEETEAKINMLTTERESLLKTGSYPVDDPIILELNTQIRSLLLKSN